MTSAKNPWNSSNSREQCTIPQETTAFCNNPPHVILDWLSSTEQPCRAVCTHIRARYVIGVREQRLRYCTHLHRLTTHCVTSHDTRFPHDLSLFYGFSSVFGHFKLVLEARFRYPVARICRTVALDPHAHEAVCSPSSLDGTTIRQRWRSGQSSP